MQGDASYYARVFVNYGLYQDSGSQLSPLYSPSVYSYNLTVNASVGNITFGSNPAESGQSITMNGVSVTSGNGYSRELTFEEGKTTTVSVVVTAEDGVTQQTYVVAVTRAAEQSDNAALASISYVSMSAAQVGNVCDNSEPDNTRHYGISSMDACKAKAVSLGEQLVWYNEMSLSLIHI